MPKPEIKPAKRVAGKSKFRLPERTPRSVDEVNPLRELLQEARAQEEAIALSESRPAADTPAIYSAGVSEAPVSLINEKQTPQAVTADDAAALFVAPTPAVIENVAATPPAESVESFEAFSRRWSAILRSGQLSICRALYEMSHAVGEADCFTSMPKLAAAAGLKERQCYNVVAQLEALGFVERPEIFNTPSQKGTVFRLHPEPRPASERGPRRYHIGSEERQD